MPDVTAAELRAAIRQLGNVMVRTDDGDASGVIIHTEMVAGHLAGLIGNREERGPCRQCSHREREHREIGSRDGGCDACECRSYLPPRAVPPPPPIAFRGAVRALGYGREGAGDGRGSMSAVYEARFRRTPDGPWEVIDVEQIAARRNHYRDALEEICDYDGKYADYPRQVAREALEGDTQPDGIRQALAELAASWAEPGNVATMTHDEIVEQGTYAECARAVLDAIGGQP